MNIFRFCTLIVLTALSAQAFADGEDALALEKKLSAEYLAKMAAEPGAQVIEQGVVLRPISESGSQTYPQVSDSVRVSYFLTDREGKTIEESITSDELVEFPLARLIKCWQVAFPKISVNSFYKISCPSDTAYGDHGAGDTIKPGAALTFRVTLYGVVPAKP